MKVKGYVVLLAMLAALLSGCGNVIRIAGETEEQVTPMPRVPQGVFTGSCTPEGTLHVWTPAEQIDPEVLAEFGTLYGVDVAETVFASDAEVVTGVRAGNSGYDLVFPSNAVVAQMIEDGLLRELDRANLPYGENLNPGLIDLPYDPGNRYTLPYLWGVTGIAYNANYFDTPPESWEQVFAPEYAPLHGGAFSMLDNDRLTIGAALRFLGVSANSDDPNDLADARDLLREQLSYPNFVGYDSETWPEALVDERLQLAHATSAGAARAASQNTAIRFLVPEEGGIIWQSNAAIPADAPNPCVAELFINYLLQPEVAAQSIAYTYANSPVPAAPLLLDPITQELMGQGFSPGMQTMARLEWLDASDAEAFEAVWAEVRGAGEPIDDGQ